MVFGLTRVALPGSPSAHVLWARHRLVNEDGTAQARFTTDRFTVRGLVDEDGSAIIVHEAPDNFANIPDRYHSHTEDVFGPDSVTLAVGDAGGRLACGVIE